MTLQSGKFYPVRETDSWGNYETRVGKFCFQDAKKKGLPKKIFVQFPNGVIELCPLRMQGTYMHINDMGHEYSQWSERPFVQINYNGVRISLPLAESKLKVALPTAS